MRIALARFRHWAAGVAGGITFHKRTEITIETEGVLIVRRGRPKRGWCPQCGREVDMLDLAQAGIHARAKRPLLRESAQSQGWHVFEDPDGALLVCLDSVTSSE